MRELKREGDREGGKSEQVGVGGEGEWVAVWLVVVRVEWRSGGVKRERRSVKTTRFVVRPEDRNRVVCLFA